MIRTAHPRINCMIERCKRGSTAFAPGTTVICGKCWRLSPKHLRDRRRKLRAALRQAERKQNLERYRRLWWLDAAVWEQIVRSLTAEPTSECMPSVLVEQLRKDGLL